MRKQRQPVQATYSWSLFDLENTYKEPRVVGDTGLREAFQFLFSGRRAEGIVHDLEMTQ